MLGKLFNQRYRLISELGRGGMSVVVTASVRLTTPNTDRSRAPSSRARSMSPLNGAVLCVFNASSVNSSSTVPPASSMHRSSAPRPWTP